MVEKGRMAVVRTGALALLALLAALAVAERAARAAEHIVRLITEDEVGRFRFEPPILLAQPGDEVRFEPDSRLHAIKSVAGMLPASEFAVRLAVRYDLQVLTFAAEPVQSPAFTKAQHDAAFWQQAAAEWRRIAEQLAAERDAQPEARP